MKAELRNLKLVVIDEVSLVSNKELYQIDMRLQEIMENDKPFGGVLIMSFGDLMQLKPVLAQWIFERFFGKDGNLQVMNELQSRWNLLKVINLEINHRQDGDKTYADLLNRLRIGEHTDEDMALLRERVRPKGHPDLKDVDLHIVCTVARGVQLNREALQ